MKYITICLSAIAINVSTLDNHLIIFKCVVRKKRVDVSLNGSEINRIKYEATLLDETRRRRRRTKLSCNLTIRNLRRIDFDLIPSVSHMMIT